MDNVDDIVSFPIAPLSFLTVVDLSDSICDALVQPFDAIPQRAEDVVRLIKAALLQKLPVASSLFENIVLEVRQFHACSVSFPLPISCTR
jgi:hypothetical protein